MREVCNAEWDDIQDRLKEKDAEIEQLKSANTDLQRECTGRGVRIADLERLLARTRRVRQQVSELKAVIWACAGIFVHRTPVTTAFIRELEEISRL